MEEKLLLGSEDNGDYIRELKERFLEESKKLWKIAFPAILARVSLFGMYVVTQAFVGHVGKLQLAAYAIIQITALRFAQGILIGMTSATDTLCGQAFGAKQYPMLGIYLQKSLIINFSASTILLPLFVFSESIFKLLGEDDDIAKAGGYISLWFIPSVYFTGFHTTIQKYLQAQLKNSIVGWVSAMSFLLHLLLTWTFVTKLGLGVAGAMGAMVTSNWLVLIGEFVYVTGGWCPDTWQGFTLLAFSNLIPALKLSLSSGFMLCLELWYNAILVLLAGYMNNAATEISAFSICVNVTGWNFMLCVGFLAAISVRVANELGNANAKAAKFSMKVTLSTSISIGIFFWILCLVFGKQIAYLFTSEKEVAETVSSLSVLLAFSVFLNSVQSVLSGIAVGAGRQATVAYINIGCYYIIGVPLGVLLAYVAQLQVKGIWIGMTIGVLTQSLVLGYITWTTNWDEQVRRASDRLNQWFSRSSEESDETSTVKK